MYIHIYTYVRIYVFIYIHIHIGGLSGPILVSSHEVTLHSSYSWEYAKIGLSLGLGINVRCPAFSFLGLSFKALGLFGAWATSRLLGGCGVGASKRGVRQWPSGARLTSSGVCIYTCIQIYMYKYTYN